MTGISEYPTATPESVWAALRETDRILTEKFAETDRLFKESRENLERQKIENDRFIKESRENFERQNKENDRLIKESRENLERQNKESREDYDRRMKKMEETMGSWSNNHGSFAEEYFINSFENGQQNFFGEKFDDIEKNAKGIKKGYRDEYDILLINGKSVAIIEIKYRAHEHDIPKIIRKAETFRINFPDYVNHQVYLGLASMSFYPAVEQECINEGIAVVKQVGNTVVINEANLKAY